jgi:hypothetical protein
MIMMMTTSNRPHHVAHTLITTGIAPSCPVNRNWLLCCHENFWRAIKDKTKWYPSNKEQPPSVTVLWQHCRGGLQAWCIWSVGLAAIVAQIAKNERICCDLFYDIPILEGEATTLFRNGGIRILIDVESYASRTESSCVPIPCGLYLYPTDTYAHTAWGESVAKEFDGLLMLMEETWHARRILLDNFCFKICSFKAQEWYRAILIDHWFMYKLYNGLMIFSGELESMWNEAVVISFKQQHLIRRIVKNTHIISII